MFVRFEISDVSNNCILTTVGGKLFLHVVFPLLYASFAADFWIRVSFSYNRHEKPYKEKKITSHLSETVPERSGNENTFHLL